MFGALGLPEILIILVIGVLIFGGVKVPGLLRSISSGARGLKKVRDTVRNPIDLDRWIREEERENGPPQEQTQYYNQNPQGPGWQQQQGYGYQGQQGPGWQGPWPPQQGGYPPQDQQPPNTPPHNGQDPPAPS